VLPPSVARRSSGAAPTSHRPTAYFEQLAAAGDQAALPSGSDDADDLEALLDAIASGVHAR
jgi:hypothetical protein